MNVAISVNTDSKTACQAERVFRNIISSLDGVEAIEAAVQARTKCDRVIVAKFGRAILHFVIEAKKLLTSRRALGRYQDLRRLPRCFTRLIFVPVISPRVGSLMMSELGLLKELLSQMQ